MVKQSPFLHFPGSSETMSARSTGARIYKSVQQLGCSSVLRIAVHRLGYTSGHYKRVTSQTRLLPETFLKTLRFPPAITPPADYAQFSGAEILQTAEQILNRRFCAFGGYEAPLTFLPSETPLRHWTAYQDDNPENDLKLIWEPARFGWAPSLIRAFAATGDKRYLTTFSDFQNQFDIQNPPFLGPNWISAQEAGIRLIHWSAAGMLLQENGFLGTPPLARLFQSIYHHACRIPHTIIYAKAQKNNHLLSEAAALYTAGCIFPTLPEGEKWKRAGWNLFHQALQYQIEENGVYIQQSINYHRLMLQLSLWMRAISRSQGQWFPQESIRKLGLSVQWLYRQMDSSSGHVPNLGHNDGSNILTFCSQEYADYRPIVQAAGQAFLGKALLASGTWDELAAWYALPEKTSSGYTENNSCASCSSSTLFSNTKPLQLQNENLRVSLRIAQFKNRPAHADLLHTDIWWNGRNILQDAGTYRYTAPDPWANSFAKAPAHNAVVIDNQEPMTWAGRFLWLDWYKSQGQINADNQITGQHSGYHKLGISCERTICLDHNQISVIDRLNSLKNTHDLHMVQIHWLLPDWKWSIQENILQLAHPQHKDERVKVSFSFSDTTAPALAESVYGYRAGKSLFTAGKGKPAPDRPTFGWVSPTYNLIQPALSLVLETALELPISIKTVFTFISQESDREQI